MATVTDIDKAQAAAAQYTLNQLKDDDASKPFLNAIQEAQQTKAALQHKRQQLKDLKQLTPKGVDDSMRDMEEAATKQFTALRATVQKEAEKLIAANTPAMPEVNVTYSARIADKYNAAGNSARREMLMKAIAGDIQLASALAHEAAQGFVNITPVMVQQLHNLVAPAPELDETASMRLQLAQIANNALSL